MKDKILAFLEGSRREHYYCCDCWYTCPAHPEGCCDDEPGDKCNCYADDYNEELDKIIILVKENM